MTPKPSTLAPPTDPERRYVFVERTRCPVCGSPSLRAYKTLPPDGDGSVSRYTRCRACGHKFIVVEE